MMPRSSPGQAHRGVLDAGAEASGYSVRETARLLAITDDAVRKRVAAGTLDASVRAGVWSVDSKQVEEARADLLRRLNAIDGRAGPGASPDEVAALRMENTRLRSALEALTHASEGLLLSNQAHLDALRQFLTPQSVAG